MFPWVLTSKTVSLYADVLAVTPWAHRLRFGALVTTNPCPLAEKQWQVMLTATFRLCLVRRLLISRVRLSPLFRALRCPSLPRSDESRLLQTRWALRSR